MSTGNSVDRMPAEMEQTLLTGYNGKLIAEIEQHVI